MQVKLNPNDALTAVLGGAPSSTNPVAHVEVDDGSDKSLAVSLNGATAVTLATGSVSGNGGTLVKGLSIYNADTGAVTVTLSHVIAGSGNTLLAVTLQVGDTLLANYAGVCVVDATGHVKQSNTSTSLQVFAITPLEWRENDGVTVCPATAASTNFGVVLGTDGTNFPTLQTIDSKAATTAVVARAVVRLPANYVAGSAITIRAHAGMLTTIADTSATLGLNVYSNAGNNTGSANLNTTVAQSINSLTFADVNFTITPTGLVAGQLLHIKMTLTVTDAATVTAVKGAVGSVALLASVSS